MDTIAKLFGECVAAIWSTATVNDMADDKKADLLADGLWRARQAAEFLGLSRAEIYLMMDRGDLVYVRFGHARRIPKRAVMELARLHRLTGEWRTAKQEEKAALTPRSPIRYST